jgi:hypothetical protein
MASKATDFTINKGLNNEFIFTIKQNDSLLPMIINPSDSFELKLFELETDLLEATLYSTQSNADGEITIHSAANGQIKIIMTEALVNRLKKERGSKAERYYLKPTYRLSIDGDTINNGMMVAKIDRVFVD